MKIISLIRRRPNILKLDYLVILALITAGVIVYANSFVNSFAWDDELLVTSNHSITSLRDPLRFFTAELAPKIGGNFYRPLQSLSYAVDYHFWGFRPFGYHLTNLLLHLANAIFIYSILMILTKQRVLSGLTALLFVIHPIQTEAVTYISGRADILAAFFMLTSLLLFLISIRRRHEILLIASLLCFILALLTKEATVIFPLLVILCGLYLKKKAEVLKHYSSRRDKYYYAILLFLGASYLLIRGLTAGPLGETLSSNPYPFYERFLTSFKVIVLYLRTLLIPFPLHMERVIPIERSFFSLPVLLSLLFLLALALITVRAYRRAPLFFLGSAWFFLALLPYLNWFPLNAEMAEHWLYLPSIGFFLLFALGIATLCSVAPCGRSKRGLKGLNGHKALHYIADNLSYNGSTNILRGIKIRLCRKIPSAVFLVVLSCFAVLTIDRNRDWKNNETIYTHTARYSPGSPRAHYNLGNIHLQKGETTKAIEEFRRAIEIKPWDLQSRRSLGKALLGLGRHQEAIKELEEAVSLRPSSAGARDELGVAYGLAGGNEKAVRELKIALTLDPTSARTHNNLASVYTNLGQFKEALAECERALKLDPGLVEANFNLGIIYYHLERMEAARAQFEKVLQLKPGLHRAAIWVERIGAKRIKQ